MTISVASSLLGEIKPDSLVQEIVETQLGIATDAEESSNEIVPADPMAGLAAYVQETYRINKDHRNTQETIWLNSWKQFRGEFSAEEQQRIQLAKERNKFASAPFIKITKTKVLAAFGQIMEVLSSDNKFPLEVTATPRPEGIADTVTVDMQTAPEAEPNMEGQDIYGYEGDGRTLEAGTTSETLIRSTYDRLKSFLKGKKVTEGPALDRTKQIELHPADKAAFELDKTIQDQLEESNAEVELRKAAFEAVLFGTGVVKAPFTETIEMPNWEKDIESGFNVYTPKIKLVPKMKQVAVWDAYPDAGARTKEDLNNMIERHLLTAQQIKKMTKGSKLFDKEAVKRALRRGPGYMKEDWEHVIVDQTHDMIEQRYEVLEYWGYIDNEMAVQYGLVEELEEEYDLDSVLVNIWVIGTEVIRATLSPFDTKEIPYYFVPYEEHPYQLWGIGVPENMSDAQMLINGHTRLSIDNLALAGSCVFEVNEAQLTPGQDMSLFPGKVFKKQGGAPGQSIFAIKFNNTAPEHYQAIDRAKQYADDTTLPSYSHGATGGIPGSTRTSSGISMMMGAAALGIKTVVKNFDHYLLSPVGQAFFRWNMQFNTDVTIKGDLQVVAKGTSQLLKREVKSQRLLSLFQVGANPTIAPMINWEYNLREFVKSMDMDPDKAVNSPSQALIYADMLRGMNVQQPSANQGPVPNSGQGGEGSPPAMGGINPADTTGAGGGNIGVGSSPLPGEAGFSQRNEES